MLHPVLGTVLHLGLRADGRALRPCASSRNVPVAETQNSINERMALPAGHFKIKEQTRLRTTSGCDSMLLQSVRLRFQHTQHKSAGPSWLVQAGGGTVMGWRIVYLRGMSIRITHHATKIQSSHTAAFTFPRSHREHWGWISGLRHRCAANKSAVGVMLSGLEQNGQGMFSATYWIYDTIGSRSNLVQPGTGKSTGPSLWWIMFKSRHAESNSAVSCVNSGLA